MSRTFGMLAVGMIALMMAGLAQACQGGGKSRPNLTERLGLEPEQRQQFEEQLAGHRERMSQLRSELRENRRSLRAMSRSETSENAQVETLIARQGELGSALSREMFSHRLALRGILTDAQVEQLQNLPKHRMGGKRRGRHPDRHHGMSPRI